MDPEVRDLIQKILIRDPKKRLGAGEKGSENDYAALKAHPLFKGVDFTTLHKQKPPITDIPSPHKKKGTTSFHVENGGVATTRKYKLSDDFSDRTKKNEEQPQNTPKIAPIFDKNVTIVLSGLVDKKCGWVFYKHRQLILNSKPRLMYYDPETNQLRGEIALHPETKAYLESKTKFIVQTPQRKYVFKQIEHTAEKWVTLINEAVKKNNEK